DCRAFPREACLSQHRLLALDTLFKSVQRRREWRAMLRILWKNLKGDATETLRSRVAEDVSTKAEVISASDADSMWKILASIIKDAAKDTLGNQKELLRAHERYKKAKKESKEAVDQVEEKAYEELYKNLDSKERANDIFKIAKARERRRSDVGYIRFIKYEGGRTITDEEEIKRRWGDYFPSLFNSRESEGREEVGEPSIMLYSNCYYSRINQAEVKISLQKMGINKAIGLDQIPIEAWKCLGDEVITWLTNLFNKTFDEVTWKTFDGKTRDLGSILEETGQEYNFTPKEGLKNNSQMVEKASGKLATPSGSTSGGV
ncbi:hypothetical protein Tco_0494774, partial [Tanacetum coccineum]